MTNVCSIIRDTAPIIYLSHVKRYTVRCADWRSVGQTDAFRHLLLSYSSTEAWEEQKAQLARKGRCRRLIRFPTL